jgi:hypothetical protein
MLPVDITTNRRQNDAGQCSTYEVRGSPVLSAARHAADLRRARLPSPAGVSHADSRPQEQPIKVEVVIHTRFTRCSGPLALGDIAYTTTLLPGEQVRLATTDRRSRFSFDSESKLSYRSEQISEEQYRLRSLRAFMSDENVVDRGK